MFKLFVIFKNGTSNEWLCDTREEAQKMLSKLGKVRGWGIKPLKE